MKISEIIDSISVVIGAVIGIIAICAPFWFVYKLFAGVYHLLDKLIDKL